MRRLTNRVHAEARSLIQTRSRPGQYLLTASLRFRAVPDSSLQLPHDGERLLVTGAAEEGIRPEGRADRGPLRLPPQGAQVLFREVRASRARRLVQGRYGKGDAASPAPATLHGFLLLLPLPAVDFRDVGDRNTLKRFYSPGTRRAKRIPRSIFRSSVVPGPCAKTCPRKTVQSSRAGEARMVIGGKKVVV